MRKPTQKIKVFIDTNVLIAGVNSVDGFRVKATLYTLLDRDQRNRPSGSGIGNSGIMQALNKQLDSRSN